MAYSQLAAPFSNMANQIFTGNQRKGKIKSLQPGYCCVKATKFSNVVKSTTFNQWVTNSDDYINL